MSSTQNTNIINEFPLSPSLNLKFPCINFLSLLNFENKDNKIPLLNNNIQLNPISPTNIFPILYNHNFKLDNNNTNSKNKESPNQYINGTNLNLFNNVNNNLSIPSMANLFITNNYSYNYLNILKKIPSTNYMSNTFKPNLNINFDNYFLNLKEAPTFHHKVNNKENLINNDIPDKINLNDNNKDDTKTSSSKQIMFKLQNQYSKKKRGRAIKEIDKKDQKPRQHSSTDFDNLLRKLQVHYLTFVIQFANIMLDNFYPSDKNFRFLNISYDAKKNVKHSYVESLKMKKMKDILIMPPSKKYKINSNQNINLEIYERIRETNSFLEDFFEITYLELFNKYYMKNSKIFEFNGISINFEKISFFSDLINANHNPLEAPSKMKQIAQSQFCEKGSTIFVVNRD
jgi:hypothetical protein